MINGNTIGRWWHVEANIVTPDKSHPDKHTHIGKQTYTVYVYFLVCFLLWLMIYWCVMTKHKFHSSVTDRYSILIINWSRNPHEKCVLCNTLLTTDVTSATMAGRTNSDVGVRCTWQRCTHCSHLINAGLLVYHWCVRNTGTTGSLVSPNSMVVIK